MRAFFKKYFLYIILVILVLILILGFFFIKLKFFNKNNLQNEVRSIVKMVGEHMYLPEGENPTIATVSDPKALGGQSFFENAKKGDKVLIYPNAKKAILYDPIADKIVTIAPLYLGDNMGQLGNKDATTLEDQF